MLAHVVCLLARVTWAGLKLWWSRPAEGKNAIRVYAILLELIADVLRQTGSLRTTIHAMSAPEPSKCVVKKSGPYG